MNNQLVVKIPHRLTQQEAVSRIESGIETLRQRFGPQISTLDTHWDGTRLDATVGVMGAKVHGLVDVLPEEVVVTVELPWLLARLKDKISGLLTQNGEALLRLK